MSKRNRLAYRIKHLRGSTEFRVTMQSEPFLIGGHGSDELSLEVLRLPLQPLKALHMMKSHTK